VESTSSEAVAPPIHASLFIELADFPTNSGYTFKQALPVAQFWAFFFPDLQM
jgi:hypothetical protein